MCEYPWQGIIIVDELTDRLYYEHKKHDGSLPIVAVNTFLPPQDENGGEDEAGERD